MLITQPHTVHPVLLRSCCKFYGAEWQEVATRLEELNGPASPSRQIVLAREPCVDTVTGGSTTRCLLDA